MSEKVISIPAMPILGQKKVPQCKIVIAGNYETLERDVNAFISSVTAVLGIDYKFAEGCEISSRAYPYHAFILFMP